MSEKIDSILKGRLGRVAGAVVGLVIGVLIVIPKFFFLLICILIGYFIGKYFDNKRKGEITIDKEIEKSKK